VELVTSSGTLWGTLSAPVIESPLMLCVPMMQGSCLQNLQVRNTFLDVIESRGDTSFLRQSSVPGFMGQIFGPMPTPQIGQTECYNWMLPAHFENALPSGSRALDNFTNQKQGTSNDSDSTAEQLSRQTSQNSALTSGRTSELPDRTPSPVRTLASLSAQKGLPTVSLPASPQNMPKPDLQMARGCGMTMLTRSTSLTVRNLPPGFTKEGFLQELRDAGFQRDRDFDVLYMSSQVGGLSSDNSQFIINLVNKTVLRAFIAAFHGRELHCDGSGGQHVFTRCLEVAATTTEELQKVEFYTAPEPQPLSMQPGQGEARFCYHCGGVITRSFRFCVQCGASLQDLKWKA